MAALLFLQFALSVSFASNGYMISCLLTSMLFLLTVLLVFRIAHPIFDDELEEIRVGLRENLEVNLKKWESAYSHPLQISNTELIVQRNDRRVSLVLRP